MLTTYTTRDYHSGKNEAILTRAEKQQVKELVRLFIFLSRIFIPCARVHVITSILRFFFA